MCVLSFSDCHLYDQRTSSPSFTQKHLISYMLWVKVSICFVVLIERRRMSYCMAIDCKRVIGVRINCSDSETVMFYVSLKVYDCPCDRAIHEIHFRVRFCICTELLFEYHMDRYFVMVEIALVTFSTLRSCLISVSCFDI